MITIVTVCFNAANDLEKTILSVLKQKNASIEYIIKDGKSSDNTDEIVEKYRKQIEEKCKFIYLSGKDNGIYDAMNIATDMATGDRILFLNAGDCLYDENVIAEVDREDSEIDIIYGDTEYIRGDKHEVQKSPNPEDIDVKKEGMFFNHQAAYIKTSLMKEYKYDTNYKLCADYEFFFRTSTAGRTYKHIDRIVVLFMLGGLSYQRSFDLLDETYAIRYKYGTLSKKEYLKLNMINTAKRKIKSFLPANMYNSLKSLNNRN